MPQEGAASFVLRDHFDVPDLTTTNDDIVNGYSFTHEDGSSALAPFTESLLGLIRQRAQSTGQI